MQNQITGDTVFYYIAFNFYVHTCPHFTPKECMRRAHQNTVKKDGANNETSEVIRYWTESQIRIAPVR